MEFYPPDAHRGRDAGRGESPSSDFRGHFPGKPVLPGVCQMWLVRRAVSEMTGQTLRYGRVREVKYLHPILPQSDCELTVRVVLTPCEQGCCVQANISTVDELKMKIKARFQ